jgi:hypothetical protein
MRNAMWLTLVAVASSSAMAAWVKVSESETAIVYVDPATLTRAGNRTTLWELTDYKIVTDENNPYRSVKRHYEFDCQEMALRSLSISTYAEKSAGGRMILTITDPAKWFLAMPGTIGETLWKIACAKPR